MHYYPLAASLDQQKMTLCPMKDPIMELVMGQREQPSFHDKALINRMYCQGKFRNVENFLEFLIF